MLKNKGKHEAYTNETKNYSDKEKRNRKTWHVVLICICVLIAIVLVGIFFLNSLYSKMNTASESVQVTPSVDYVVELEKDTEEEDTVSSDEIQSIEEELLENAAGNSENEEAPEGVFSVLLLGNDSRNNLTDERTDVMLLVTVNHDTKKIVLTSFLRDLYVYIPDVGYNRLNAANVYGGPALTIATIEQNFGVTIDAYAAISFGCFEDVIDACGGVDIELSAAEVDVINSVGYIGSDAGLYHLDGAHALDYVRIRYLDSDFGRTNRQRTVLSALWQQAKDSSLVELYNLLDLVLPQITTDLTRGECLSLAMQVSKIKDYELSTLYIPADGLYSDEIIYGMMVLVPDIESNSSLVFNTLYSEN